MNDELLSYQYLWDGTSSQWGLMDVNPEATAQYLIVNTETKMAMLIDDDELATQIIGRMLEAKVRIFLANKEIKNDR
jgi:hypothetical protein